MTPPEAADAAFIEESKRCAEAIKRRIGRIAAVFRAFQAASRNPSAGFLVRFRTVMRVSGS